MTGDAFGAAMTTAADVEAWRAGALFEFGDPTEPVCQLFFRWDPALLDYQGDELVCGTTHDSVLMLLFGGKGGGLVPLPVRAGEPTIAATGELEAFGAVRITPDVWALSPSLNIPGSLHGFVVLYGVPTPAPWESLIVLASAGAATSPRRCRVCGCTDMRACPGGCRWVEVDLCSRCAR